MTADAGTEEEIPPPRPSPPPSGMDGVAEKESFQRTEKVDDHDAPLDRAVEA